MASPTDIDLATLTLMARIGNARTKPVCRMRTIDIQGDTDATVEIADIVREWAAALEDAVQSLGDIAGIGPKGTAGAMQDALEQSVLDDLKRHERHLEDA